MYVYVCIIFHLRTRKSTKKKRIRETSVSRDILEPTAIKQRTESFRGAFKCCQCASQSDSKHDRTIQRVRED